jgi:amino acid transporter
VFLLFEIFTIATNITLPQKAVMNSTTVLSDLATAVGGSTTGKIMIVAVMLSTIATLETTLIQVSRSLFAMGRDNTLPKLLGRIHPTRRTPAVATLIVAGVSLALFFGANFIGSVGTIMNDAILAIGVQIAVYYSLAAFSVVVAYRGEIFKSVGNMLCIGLLPLVGAAFMLFTLGENIFGPNLNGETKIIALVSLALGLIPLGVYWAKRVPYYTRGAQLASETELLDLAEPVSGAAPTVAA